MLQGSCGAPWGSVPLGCSWGSRAAPGRTGWAGSERGNVSAVTPARPGVAATCSYLELFCLPRVPHPFLPLPVELLASLRAARSPRVAHGWEEPLGLHPLPCQPFAACPEGPGAVTVPCTSLRAESRSELRFLQLSWKWKSLLQEWGTEMHGFALLS